MMIKDEDGDSFGVSGRVGSPDPAGSHHPEARHVNEVDEIIAALENEKGVRDLEPYSVHEATLNADDMMVKAYMEIWDHYACAYNAVAHRREVDYCAEKLEQLACAIMGAPVSFDGPDDPPFRVLLWNIGQERARLMGIAERFQRDEARLQEQIERSWKHAEQLRVLAEWMGVKPIPDDPEEIAEAIKETYRRSGRAQ